MVRLNDALLNWLIDLIIFNQSMRRSDRKRWNRTIPTNIVNRSQFVEICWCSAQIQISSLILRKNDSNETISIIPIRSRDPEAGLIHGRLLSLLGRNLVRVGIRLLLGLLRDAARLLLNGLVRVLDVPPLGKMHDGSNANLQKRCGRKIVSSNIKKQENAIFESSQMY